MSFRLLNISSMYSGSLELFYNKHPDVSKMSYEDHYNLLLNDTTEFVGSYNRNFRKLGIDTKCIISNDKSLQKKWKQENGTGTEGNETILQQQVGAFNPEILWLENLNYIDEKWIKHIREDIRSIKLIAAYHCAPYNRALLEKLKYVDFVVTCTPGLRLTLENEGIRTYLVYHGFDSDILSKLDKNFTGFAESFIFSGSLFPGKDIHNDRIYFIERILNEGIDLRLYVNLEKSYRIKMKNILYYIAKTLKSLNITEIINNYQVFKYSDARIKSYPGSIIRANQSPLYGKDMYSLFERSKIVLNYHIGVAGEYAGNMRLFEVTGLGSCLLTDNKKNLGELFSVGSEIVAYDGVEDCIEKARWLIEHEEERRDIADRGRQRTLKSHTVADRCKEIIEIIGSELKSIKIN